MTAALFLVALVVPAGMVLTLVVKPYDPNTRAVERAIRREADLRARRRAAEARR